MKRGLRCAIGYLKSVYPTGMVPDTLHHNAGVEIMASTLAHSLRRAAKGGKGEVLVSYHPDNTGVNIAYYRWNPDYKPQERPVKAPTRALALYFYTIPGIKVPSAYYESLKALRFAIRFRTDCLIWQGSHEAPVLVEPEAV